MRRSRRVAVEVDNVEDSVTGLPISHLRRLVAKASLAFQVYILKSKIRNL